MPGLVTNLDSQFLVIKATFNGDTRRFRMAHVPHYPMDLGRLSTTIRFHFDLSDEREYFLNYLNSDFEAIRLDSDADFAEALSHASVISETEEELSVYIEEAYDHELSEVVKEVKDWYQSLVATTVSRTQHLFEQLAHGLDSLESDLDDSDSDESDPENEFGDFLSAPPAAASAESLMVIGTSVTLHDAALCEQGPEDLDDSDLDDDSDSEINFSTSAPESLAIVGTSMPIHTGEPLSPGEVSESRQSIFWTTPEAVRRPNVPHAGESRQAIFWSAPAPIRKPHVSNTTGVKPKPESIFTVPFPAFVSFPPSPTRTMPVFSLSECTPFPFNPVTASCANCSAQKISVAVATSTEPAAPSANMNVGTEDFKFYVSIGTQCDLEETSQSVDAVTSTTLDEEQSAAIHDFVDKIIEDVIESLVFPKVAAPSTDEPQVTEEGFELVEVV